MSAQIGIKNVGSLSIQKCASGVKIVDRLYAQKRGKTCPKIVVSWWPARPELGTELFYNLSIRFDDIDSIEMAAKWASEAADIEHVSVSLEELKGVDVAPHDFEPIEVRNDSMYICIEWENFVVSDLKDQANLPRLISYSSTKKSEFKRVRDWAAQNQKRLETMDFSQVWTALTKEANVYPHYYCAMD